MKTLAQQIDDLVATHFSNDRRKTDLWWLAANPMLGGVSPHNMIVLDRGQTLLLFVQQQISLNPEAYR